MARAVDKDDAMLTLSSAL